MGVVCLTNELSSFKADDVTDDVTSERSEIHRFVNANTEYAMMDL